MKGKGLAVLIAILVFVSGCSNEAIVKTEKKVVNTIVVSQQEQSMGISYLGMVRAKDVKKYAFLSGGKIERIYVKEGEKVAAGEKLAKIDTSSQEIYKNSAQVNVMSLENALETAKSALDAAEILHEDGRLADKEWEAQESQYIVLKGNYEVALDSLKQAEKQIEDSLIYADESGYVMNIPYEEGEIIAAGYPVIIMKGSQKIISVGVSADDISKITKESVATIDGKLDATVDSIGQYPDEKTRAYIVEILFDSDEYEIGDMVEVEIAIGKENTCFIPINSIFNIDGLDYVYVVNTEGIVNRKQISKGVIIEERVQVDGLAPETVIISEGVKNIRENDQVIFSIEPTIGETNSEKQFN